MPTFGYTTLITQVDDSTINFEILGGLTPIVPVTSTFTNQRTVVVANMVASFPYDPLPNSYNLDSTVAGMGSVFGDSVYRCIGSFTRGGDTYNADNYFLVTTTIDAGIAALPSTTPAEIARKAYLVGLGQTIQAAPLTTNLERAVVNALIGVVESYLFHLTNASVGVTATLSAPTDMDADISVLAFTYTTWGGWYNALTNTLTSVLYPYTFNFDPNNGGTYTVVNPTDYPDGVYENYMSVLGSISSTDANLFYGTGYEIVTTTIDDQIALYGTNHDPNNTAEAILYAELLANQAAWAVAFAANDYTEANALIAASQAIVLNQGLSIELFAALTSDNLMNVYFDALPSGTYTNPTGVITNTLTGVSFTFDGFPSSNLDLATVLNSETLGFGADFPDGVYQVQVQFFVDGLLFTCLCYLVVTTDWQCCIDKAVGKKCGKSNTALMQANLTNAVRIVAVYSDVNTANAFISEGYRECSGCGCGCS